ncbi:VOC family protein [Zhihengliuella somnathii]
MSISISQLHVFTTDPEAALAFYRDALGFTVAFEVENDGFTWVNLAPPGQEGVMLVLMHPRVGRSEADGQALETLLAKGELGAFHLRADRLEETFEKIAQVPGAEIVQEPTDQPWGVRDGAVRDPAGNLIRIEQA